MYSTQADRQAVFEQLAHACASGRADARRPAALPSGLRALDEHLATGGWPVGALTELLLERPGIGELRLLMPALRQLTAERQLAFINPPFLPYAPALAQHGIALERVAVIRTADRVDGLWAAEQTLRCAVVGAVVAWPGEIAGKELRRLQLAAETGGNLGILYRPAIAARLPSPAALRLRLQPLEEGLLIEVLKCRGGRAGTTLQCAFDPAPRAA
jgi:hypothetical protein